MNNLTLPSETQILFSSIKIKNCNKSIIYFLIKNDKIVYIGQSINGFKRLFTHSLKDFDAINFIYVKKENLDDVERFYIKKYNPVLNRTKGNYTKNNIYISTTEEELDLKLEF